MKFGKVDDASLIDFRLPEDATETADLLKKKNNKLPTVIYIGCAKWNKKDLKGFYPQNVKDELSYYAKEFNSIELNATFYKMPNLAQVEKWKDKVPSGFKFCPKITNSISHFKKLVNVKKEIEQFCNAVAGFDDNLGTIFLQLHDNFRPKDFDILSNFLDNFPQGMPLAIEVRNHQWIEDKKMFFQYNSLLENLGIPNIIVDTAGRRDLLHMHLTTDVAFVRYVGANTPTDYSRLDEWAERIADWNNKGLKTLYFFIHQNIEVESPLLASYFIKKLNGALNIDLRIPNKDQSENLLF